MSALPEAGRDLEAILPLSPMGQLDPVAELLRKVGRQEVLSAAAARQGHRRPHPLPGDHPVAVVGPGPARARRGGQAGLSRLLKTILDIDVDPQVAVGADRKEIQRRIRTPSRRGPGGLPRGRRPDGRADGGHHQAADRADRRPGHVRDEMLRVLRENFFGLFAKARVEPWLDEAALYTTVEAMRRYEAELKHLVEVGSRPTPAPSARRLPWATSARTASGSTPWRSVTSSRPARPRCRTS